MSSSCLVGAPPSFKVLTCIYAADEYDDDRVRTPFGSFRGRHGLNIDAGESQRRQGMATAMPELRELDEPDNPYGRQAMPCRATT